MLTTYLALGFLAAPAPPASAITTPSERTITLTRAGGSFTAQQDLDPSDKLDYLVDATQLLDSGESVASMAIALRPAAIALGFQIGNAPPYALTPLDPARLRFWASVDPASQASTDWATPQKCAVDADITTDSTPPRHYQRSFSVTVVQK